MKKEQKTLSGRSKILDVDPVYPRADAIKRAAEIIEHGGIVIFPTACLYGLAADAMNGDAVRKIYDIKKRPAENPILVLVENLEAVNTITVSIPLAAKRIMKQFWPGNVTLIFEAKTDMPSITTAGTGKIGIRMPGHQVAMALAKQTKRPLTGTSANISNTAGCSRISDIEPEIVERVDLVLDAGALKGGVGSTVVDVTTTPPEILREGTIAAADILNCLDC